MNQAANLRPRNPFSGHGRKLSQGNIEAGLNQLETIHTVPLTQIEFGEVGMIAVKQIDASQASQAPGTNLGLNESIPLTSIDEMFLSGTPLRSPKSRRARYVSGESALEASVPMKMETGTSRKSSLPDTWERFGRCVRLAKSEKATWPSAWSVR